MKSVTQFPKREQVAAVYIVRALAIIGVILVHTSSIPLGMLHPESNTFPIYNFINIFNKYGTPTFIFLSAFVLFYSYYHRPFTRKLILRFYKRRLLYILLPYLIFSLCYYVIQTYYVHGKSWEEFMGHASFKDLVYMLIMGKAFYHLYFLFISLQFYLLFPALLWLFQRYKPLTRNLIWVGIVLQWAFILANQFVWQYPEKGSLCFSYISNYFLGAFVGIYYESITNWVFVTNKHICSRKICFWLMLGMVWSVSAAANVYIWYQLRTQEFVMHALVYEALWNLHTYTTSLVLFQIAYFLLAKLSRVGVNVLLHLGSVSFGIYLLHAGLLSFYFNMPIEGSSPPIYHSFVVGGFVWTLLSSWLIVGLAFKFTKGAWILFGPLPTSTSLRKESTSKYYGLIRSDRQLQIYK